MKIFSIELGHYLGNRSGSKLEAICELETMGPKSMGICMGCMVADKHSIEGFEVEVGGCPQMSSYEVDFPKWKKKTKDT